MGMWDMPSKHEVGDTELRFNPYHDPTNGRFTTANGGSGGGAGGFLYSKGGKSAYVFNANKGEDFDDDEYERWKASRNSNINPKRFVNNSGWYSQKMRTDYNEIEEKVNKTKSLNVLSRYRKRAEGNQNAIKASIASADYSRDKNINTVRLRQFDRKYDALLKNIDDKIKNW